MFQMPASTKMSQQTGVMDLKALPFLPSSVVPAGLTSGSFSHTMIMMAIGTAMSMPMKA